MDSVTHPKPDPEIYLKLFERMGMSPEACWVFEDSVQGATAARAAGARVIGLTTSLRAKTLAPLEGVLPDFRDVPGLCRLIGPDLAEKALEFEKNQHSDNA